MFGSESSDVSHFVYAQVVQTLDTDVFFYPPLVPFEMISLLRRCGCARLATALSARGTHVSRSNDGSNGRQSRMFDEP